MFTKMFTVYSIYLILEQYLTVDITRIYLFEVTTLRLVTK